MLIAVLADIHGNLPALEAVLEDARQQGAKTYLAAGDMVTGPLANAVIERLVSLGTRMILGNNDQYMLGYARNTLPEPWLTHNQFGYARHSYQLMSPSTLEIIAGLSEQLNIGADIDSAAPFRMVHGSPRRVAGGIYPQIDIAPLVDALHMIHENTLVCGHTHQQWVIELNGKLAINPGAVTGGLNGDPRAHYALLEWVGDSWRVYPRQVVYPGEQITAAFRESGLLEASGGFGRACLESFRTGSNAPAEFVNYAYRLAHEAGVDDGFVPDDIWRAAEKRFPWSD